VCAVHVQHQIKRTLLGESALMQVRELAQANGVEHRTALAERVCQRFGFIDARGRAQRSGCLKALRELERAGHITLPAPRTQGRCVAAARGLGAPVAVPEAVPAQVEALCELELVRVRTEAQRRVWTALMAHEHPRGSGALVGCQLRYLVGSAHGWLGALGFAAAACTLAPRERWIGWDAEQRRAHLHRVVGLARFLIRPSVQCHNLASHVLGRALRALPQDFEQCYGYRPWLVESFVETSAHTGASYRAANWTRVGQTCGRGRQDRAHAGAETLKDIYVYVLEREFRTHLGVAEPACRDAPLAPHEGLDGAQWVHHEFADAPLGDRRLSRRLVDSVQRQAEDPMRAFAAVAKSDWAAVKGYYRLIDQPDDSAVTPANILLPHRERTLRRMQAQRTVLCIQDGTDLNFAKRPQCAGLGVIGTNQTGARTRGLHLHSTFAVSTEGLALGVLRAHFEAPVPRAKDGPETAPEDKKSFQWIEGLRDCVELSKKLPDTRVISVMDREGDIFELFDEQRRTSRVELLVRARVDRRIEGEDGQSTTKLFDTVRQAPVQGHREILVQRASARPKASKQQAKVKREQRTAKLALRYQRITLAPTASEYKERPAIELWAVHAGELDAPQGSRPIEWFLLSTVPVTSPDEAAQMLHWYTLRWRIEDWHRVLKTGCRVEKLGHDTAERLERAIAIRLVIAWRVMLMTLLGREVPQLPPEMLFSELEITVLGAFAQSRGLAVPDTLGDAVVMLARIGGYLARNHDPPPGHQLMWQGYITLSAMAVGFALRDQFP
jgi:hypothetical protein